LLSVGERRKRKRGKEGVGGQVSLWVDGGNVEAPKKREKKGKVSVTAAAGCGVRGRFSLKKEKKKKKGGKGGGKPPAVKKKKKKRGGGEGGTGQPTFGGPPNPSYLCGTGEGKGGGGGGGGGVASGPGSFLDGVGVG